MKNLNFTHFLIIFLTVLLMSFTKPIETKKQMIGTWQICRSDSSLETKLGGKEGATRYFIIGQKTFVIADVDLNENTFVADFIGSYSLDNNIYKEQIKYTHPSLKSFKGNVLKFQINLKNGYLIKKGIDNSYNEIWKYIEL